MTNGEMRIAIDGVDHWVRVAGADQPGPPVVLIHGGPGGNAHMLEYSVGRVLAQTTPVVFYEQRGCGRSAWGGPYVMDRLVADLDGLRHALGLSSFVPVGSSFGGQVAAEYALAYRDRVEKLVLFAPAIWGPLRCAGRLASLDAIADEPFRARVRAHAGELSHAPGDLGFPDVEPLWREMGSLLPRFMLADPANEASVVPAPPEIGPCDPAFRDAFPLDLAGDRLLIDDLAGLDVPTLIAVGLYDRTVGVDACRDLADRMPDARLEVLARSSHNTIEEPDLLARLITGFLA